MSERLCEPLRPPVDGPRSRLLTLLRFKVGDGRRAMVLRTRPLTTWSSPRPQPCLPGAMSHGPRFPRDGPYHSALCDGLERTIRLMDGVCGPTFSTSPDVGTSPPV